MIILNYFVAFLFRMPYINNMSNGEIQMNVNDAVTFADRLLEVVEYARRRDVTRLGLENEILDIVTQLRSYADQLDTDMYNAIKAEVDDYNARHKGI